MSRKARFYPEIYWLSESGDPAPHSQSAFGFLSIAAFPFYKKWTGSELLWMSFSWCGIWNIEDFFWRNNFIKCSTMSPLPPSLHACSLWSHICLWTFIFFPRSVSGLDKEPDLVHMEAHTPDGSEWPEHVFALESRNKQGLIRSKIPLPQGHSTGSPSQ